MTVYDLAAIAQRVNHAEARAALEWADGYIMGLLAERAQIIETLRERTEAEAQAWEQAGADRIELNLVLLEVEQLRSSLAQRTAQVEELKKALEQAKSDANTQLGWLYRRQWDRAAAIDLLDLTVRACDTALRALLADEGRGG